jgi:hypothetical protein
MQANIAVKQGYAAHYQDVIGLIKQPFTQKGNILTIPLDERYCMVSGDGWMDWCCLFSVSFCPYDEDFCC